MKGYTNKEFNLGLGKTLVLGGSRVALFVPRLLGKISEKLILSPVTELTTGMAYNDIKQQSIDIATIVENKRANEMQTEIDARTQKVENWARDERGNVQDHFWYRAHKNKLDGLVSKQSRLREAPRRIMVAAAYVQLMRVNGKKHTEELKREYDAEMLRRKFYDTVSRIAEIKGQLASMDALRTKLTNELSGLETTRDDLLRENPALMAEIAQEEQNKTM